MLKQITIKNFALIDQLSLDFHNQLNILTGETGAGKSIVIDALRITLGGRIQSSQLRDPQKPCIVESIFEIEDEKIRSLEELQDFLSDDESELIIQRQFLPDGKNRIKINGLTVTVTQLKSIGNHLIDFHGAHDHQMLLSVDSHLGMLDQLIDFKQSISEYQKIFCEYKNVQKQLKTLKDMGQSRERDLDLLGHQVKELEQVPLEEVHYEQLKQEQVKLDNAQNLQDHLSQLLELLDGDSQGASDFIRKAFTPMRALNDIDQNTSSLNDLLTQTQETNEQLILELRDYTHTLSFDPQKAQEIHQQCDAYDSVLRKYGPSLLDAKSFYNEAREKYDLLTNMEHNDAHLQTSLEKLTKDLTKKAKVIRKLREKGAESLKKTIEKELYELGFSHVSFEARIETSDFHTSGFDEVVFYISPNTGVDLKPLSDIVSSGEAARVMLALKKALIQVDPIPVLIFDEIDAQIGGRLGTVTGEKLREISKFRQVILITHLPQIASFADTHFKVSKSVKNKCALTEVVALDQDQRVKELAAMMSGEKTSQISVKHAHDLLANANR